MNINCLIILKIIFDFSIKLSLSQCQFNVNEDFISGKKCRKTVKEPLFLEDNNGIKSFILPDKQGNMIFQNQQQIAIGCPTYGRGTNFLSLRKQVYARKEMRKI